MESSWPSQIRTVYGDHKRMIDTYFSMYEGIYFTGDGARRDEDGYYWITGRVDDVLNVSGHRLGTAEVESALVLHPKVAEAAVVGFEHPIKGQGIYAYVTLMTDNIFTEELRIELRNFVGKANRRNSCQSYSGRSRPAKDQVREDNETNTKKIAEGVVDSLGDTSTLADPSVASDLVQNKQSLSDVSYKYLNFLYIFRRLCNQSRW